MTRTVDASPIPSSDLGTSPILEAVLQLLILLNGTRRALAVFEGPVPLEGAALDELLSSAEGRVQYLQALKPPAGMSGLFNGLRQVLEIWRNALAALRAGDSPRAAALAGDVRRKSDGMAYLFQVNLPQRMRAFRTSTHGSGYIN
jgi:hypothetical protein